MPPPPRRGGYGGRTGCATATRCQRWESMVTHQHTHLSEVPNRHHLTSAATPSRKNSGHQVI